MVTRVAAKCRVEKIVDVNLYCSFSLEYSN